MRAFLTFVPRVSWAMADLGLPSHVCQWRQHLLQPVEPWWPICAAAIGRSAPRRCALIQGGGGCVVLAPHAHMVLFVLVMQRKLLSRHMFETGAAREYIALLGVVTSCTAGRVYLDNLAAWRTRGSACLDAVVPDASVHGAGSAAAASSNDTEATSALSRLRAASGVNNLRSPHRASNSASGSAFGFGSSGATSSSGAGGSSSRSRGSVVGAAPTAAGVGGEGAGSVIAAMASQARFGSDLIGLLASLGAKPQRHYLCRQLLACLDFSGRPDDGEAVNDSARHLLHTWMLDEHMPASLRLCVARLCPVVGTHTHSTCLTVPLLAGSRLASCAYCFGEGCPDSLRFDVLGVLLLRQLRCKRHFCVSHHAPVGRRFAGGATCRCVRSFTSHAAGVRFPDRNREFRAWCAGRGC